MVEGCRAPSVPLVMVASFLIGSVPVAGLVGRRLAGIELTRTGSRSVTTTNLLLTVGPRLGGFVGCAEVGKGVVAARLSAGQRPVARGIAGAFVIAGHNWSPFLRGSGGRGIAPAIGVLGVLDRPAACVLAAGPVVGIATRRPVPAMTVATVLTVPIVAMVSGRQAVVTVATVLAPVAVKSLVRRLVVGGQKSINPLDRGARA
jgi:glycerol-3-phosphate acyltransferase PlsY